MLEQIRALPFDELKTLHREIGALLAEKRYEKLEAIKNEIATLGFTAEELTPKAVRGPKKASQKYRNPETGDVWGGRGQRPQWIKDALDEGRQLDEFLVTP
ncbi:MAG: H-NS family nucleoid-associated regulatory protein [Hyphomicrobiaceae bacterium]